MSLFGYRKKGQGAIEFAVMFSIIIILFLGIFIFLSNQFGTIDRIRVVSENVALGNKLIDEVNIAHRSPIGYQKNISFNSIDPDTGIKIRFQRVGSYQSIKEVVLQDPDGNEQIIFIPSNMHFQAEICNDGYAPPPPSTDPPLAMPDDRVRGDHELLRTKDGVALCCNDPTALGEKDGCNGVLPYQETLGQDILCKGVVDSEQTPIFIDCNDFDSLEDSITYIHFNCPAAQRVDWVLTLTDDDGVDDQAAAGTALTRVQSTRYFEDDFLTTSEKFNDIVSGLTPPFTNVQISANCQIRGTDGVWTNINAIQTTSTWTLS